MVNIESLLDRAMDSDEGEACVSVAHGAGFRIGLGARIAPGSAPTIFIEVVLDPFPERPRVSPQALAGQAELVARLSARGYSITCDEDGTITCEGTLSMQAAEREVQTVRRLLASAQPRRRASRSTMTRG